jgi:raffinose/stachyose/melibiose transport system permease protein
MNRGRRGFLVFALAPAFIVFIGLVAVPGVRAFIYSLQKWDGFGEPKWVGLSNFETLLADPLFYAALRHNAFLMVAAGAITISLALFFANVLHRGVRGAGVFRVAFFFPNVIASVAVATLWILIYSTGNFGVVNAFLLWMQRTLDTVGVEFMKDQLPFAFTDTNILLYAIVPMMVWAATGFYMVLFLAAMESIPVELYEASELDGASGARQFRHVTLPLVREVLVVGVVFFIISTAKFFDPIFVMENQYPTPDTHVLATLLYQKVFSEYNVGYAAAVAVVLFALVFVATLVTLRWSRREALEY